MDIQHRAEGGSVLTANNPKQAPRPVAAMLAGAAGGIAGSLAMNAFQALWSKVVPMPESGEPSTVKVAEAISQSAGAAIPSEEKPIAGQIVHYAFGAVLGGAYGLLAEYWPEVAMGAGTLFGASSALLFDEVGVPAAGLSGPPQEAPLITHAYAIASHLVYGLCTDGVRRAALATTCQ